ncbi:hypothetical protein M9H77_21516 [Catharanthus roseus]|uniref:Uncharacterized protein n=1 Tax=Catharanthus roseus TaxID=4058 RepID=A0ACC0AQH3_CATRO|nr:hypothetical protein M9H77_21516 [Catharanthus roseus]
MGGTTWRLGIKKKKEKKNFVISRGEPEMKVAFLEVPPALRLSFFRQSLSRTTLPLPSSSLFGSGDDDGTGFLFSSRRPVLLCSALLLLLAALLLLLAAVAVHGSYHCFSAIGGHAARCSSVASMLLCFSAAALFLSSASLLQCCCLRLLSASLLFEEKGFNMDKYFEKWKRGSKQVEETLSKKPPIRVEFSNCKNIGDPGLHELRRMYVAKGPTQPCDLKFPQTDFELSNNPHSGVVIQLLGFKNQRQNVEYMLSKQSSQTEIDYRARLTAVVKLV